MDSPKPVIYVDFDRTLVKENSSRLFEQLLLESHPGLSASLARMLFHSPAGRLVSPCLTIIARLFYDGKDLRSLLLSLVRRLPERVYLNTIFETAARLSLNPGLKKSLTGKKIMILSRGLRPIILAFCQQHRQIRLEAPPIASDLHFSSGRLGIRLLSNREKLNHLLRQASFVYITDSAVEVNYLRKNLGEENLVVSTTNTEGGSLFRIHYHGGEEKK